MGVPARHREPARSGEAGGPPGNRRVLASRRTLKVRVAGAYTRGRQAERPYNSRSLRSAQPRKRVPSFVVAAGDS